MQDTGSHFAIVGKQLQPTKINAMQFMHILFKRSYNMIIVEEELIQLPKVKLCRGIKIQAGVVSTSNGVTFLRDGS